MSEGTHGHGTTLAGTGSAGTVGNIITITNTQTRDSIDFSTMESTDKFREFISGMADAGELTLTVNYDGSDSGVANSLNADFQGGTTSQWTVTFPDTSTWVCNGFITNLGHAIPFDDKITQDVTIKLTGKPVFTDVAP